MISAVLKFFSLCVLFALIIVFFSQKANAEEIYFDNTKYILKYSALNPDFKGYFNEYYQQNENRGNWTKMLGIYHYPEENFPIKFAKKFDKIVESSENALLIKLMENKKQEKAVISFLVNNNENNKNCFEYNIYKYEKHPQKGSVLLKYAAKYFCCSDNDITRTGNKIREQNDNFMGQLIISPMPAVVEKNIGN